MVVLWLLSLVATYGLTRRRILKHVDKVLLQRGEFRRKSYQENSLEKRLFFAQLLIVFLVLAVVMLVGRLHGAA